MKIFISVSAASPGDVKKSKAALKEYNAIVNAIVKLKAKREGLVAKLKAKKIKSSDSPELGKIKKEIESLLAKRTKLLADLKKKRITLPKLGRATVNQAQTKSKTSAESDSKSDAQYKALMDKLVDVEADMEEMRDDGKSSTRAYKALEEKQSAIEMKLMAFKGKKKPLAPHTKSKSPSKTTQAGKRPTPVSKGGPKEKIFYYNGLIRELTASIKERNAELEEEWDQMNPKKRPSISALKRTDKQLNNAKRKIAKYTKMIADLK